MGNPRDTLWIGGAQWSGKSTVAHLLTARHPLLRYVYDYHDARSHSERARANPDRFPAFAAFLTALDADSNAVWVDPTPEEMAATARQIFRERFEMVIDDVAAMPDGEQVLAEGWGLRPELVVPLLSDPRQAVFLVPTDAFRALQLAELNRARRVEAPRLRDTGRAQRNRVERDRLLAVEVVEQAERFGLTVIRVDGSEDVHAVTARVERQFRGFLPRWLY